MNTTEKLKPLLRELNGMKLKGDEYALFLFHSVTDGCAISFLAGNEDTGITLVSSDEEYYNFNEGFTKDDLILHKQHILNLAINILKNDVKMFQIFENGMKQVKDERSNVN